ncbi:MAG: hypothetical protein R8G01_03920 [Ilumatobacteraceae bacterium]|nr:hypothetical protein [Ilumatobacteraceae bacterium]
MGVVVGDEDPVDEVVADRWRIEPVSGTGEFVHTGRDVLHDLLAFELRQQSVHASGEPAGRCGGFDGALAQRMNDHAVPLEQFQEPVDVTGVTGESVDAPDDQVRDLVSFDQLDQLLHGGPVEVLAR